MSDKSHENEIFDNENKYDLYHKSDDYSVIEEYIIPINICINNCNNSDDHSDLIDLLDCYVEEFGEDSVQKMESAVGGYPMWFDISFHTKCIECVKIFFQYGCSIYDKDENGQTVKCYGDKNFLDKIEELHKSIVEEYCLKRRREILFNY